MKGRKGVIAGCRLGEESPFPERHGPRKSLVVVRCGSWPDAKCRAIAIRPLRPTTNRRHRVGYAGRGECGYSVPHGNRLQCRTARPRIPRSRESTRDDTRSLIRSTDLARKETLAARSATSSDRRQLHRHKQRPNAGKQAWETPLVEVYTCIYK